MLATDGSGNATTAAGSEESSTDALEMMTAEDAVSSHPLYTAGQYVWYVVPPVILLFGNFGNVMTIVIMRRMKSSGEAVINIYFTALALVDLFTLDILLLFDWVGVTFGYYVQYEHDVLCKLFNNTVSCLSISGWIVVGLSCHRAVSVVWPHRVKVMCTRRLVTGLVVGMSAFFLVLYSHYMYGYRLERSEDSGRLVCVMRAGSYAAFVQHVFSYVDLVFYCLLPFSCIFLANAMLVWTLRRAVREVRDKLAADRGSMSGSGSGSGSDQGVAREKAANSVTLTIVVVSVSFMVLTLPVSVYYIASFIYDPSAVMTAADIAESHLTRVVTFMLMFSNNAINFYLYCLTGRKFRQEFVSIFCPRRL